MSDHQQTPGESSLTEQAALIHHDAAVAEHLMALAMDSPDGDEGLAKVDAVMGEVIARATRFRIQLGEERAAARKIPAPSEFGAP
ncbi:hypothetical protein ACWFMI_23960 [Nocardiopsis terrae]|uniref:hypothetical protein n=1 Tax=Streptomyces sp. NPDC057554 TaxID=3350538 RepID=UPI003692C75B